VTASRVADSLDLQTILVTLALVALGLFAIASATMEHGSAVWRAQVVWLFVAAAGAAVIVFVDYRLWAQMALALHGGVIVLLILVLLVGTEVGGNRSWLAYGPLHLQPSELAKWTTCLVLAAYLARRVRGRLGLRQIVEMGLLIGAPVALIALQPDMGTAVIFIPIYLAALLLGGVRWKVIAIFVLIALLLTPLLWIQLADYQKERIRSVIDPGRDPSGVGYQVRQSKIAIGSGGMIVKGPFRGTQSQLNFLPAQHTDFIIAVLAEELGFVGVAIVLGLFYYLFYRGIAAARASQDRLGTYVCLLVVAWLAGQMAVNVGMVLGRLPTIGVPLPLLSYGGSSLVSAICGIGLILSVRARRFVN